MTESRNAKFRRFAAQDHGDEFTHEGQEPRASLQLSRIWQGCQVSPVGSDYPDYTEQCYL